MDFSQDRGSAPEKNSADASASEAAADVPEGENKADAAQGPMARPISGEVIGSRSGPSAADGRAKARQGSAIVLIPPVTRSTDGSQSPHHFTAKDAPSDADFTAERVSPRASFKQGWTKEGFALKQGWLRYGAPAALGFCLFGVGIATGSQFFGAAAPARSAAQMVSAATKLAQANGEQIEMRHLTKKLGDEIHTLQARIEALRVAVRSQSPEEMRGLKKGLDGLKASFETAKAETDASTASVTARLDRMEREEAKLEKSSQKTSRAETSTGAPATTGSIAKAAAPHGAAVETALVGPTLPKGQAQPLPPAAEPKKKLQLLADWVVRDVYEGVALVDGPEGSIEVARGDSIPGAGRVESIERKNGGWIIITSRGIVGSLGD